MQNSISYPFIFIGGKDNSYVFTTNEKVIYEVKFKHSDYIFGKNSLYTQHTFEFVIDILQSFNDKLPPPDRNIPITAANIFLDFSKMNKI